MHYGKLHSEDMHFFQEQDGEIGLSICQKSTFFCSGIQIIHVSNSEANPRYRVSGFRISVILLYVYILCFSLFACVYIVQAEGSGFSTHRICSMCIQRGMRRAMGRDDRRLKINGQALAVEKPSPIL